jgi:hypothetical protein
MHLPAAHAFVDRPSRPHASSIGRDGVHVKNAPLPFPAMPMNEAHCVAPKNAGFGREVSLRISRSFHCSTGNFLGYVPGSDKALALTLTGFVPLNMPAFAGRTVCLTPILRGQGGTKVRRSPTDRGFPTPAQAFGSSTHPTACSDNEETRDTTISCTMWTRRSIEQVEHPKKPEYHPGAPNIRTHAGAFMTARTRWNADAKLECPRVNSLFRPTNL